MIDIQPFLDRLEEAKETQNNKNALQYALWRQGYRKQLYFT